MTTWPMMFIKNKIIPKINDKATVLPWIKHTTDAVPKKIIGVEVIVYKYMILLFLLINKVTRDTKSNNIERQVGIKAYSNTLALIPSF